MLDVGRVVEIGRRSSHVTSRHAGGGLVRRLVRRLVRPGTARVRNGNFQSGNFHLGNFH